MAYDIRCTDITYIKLYIIPGSYCTHLGLSRDDVLYYNYEGTYTVTSDLCYGKNQFHSQNIVNNKDYFITFNGEQCRWILTVGNITCGRFSTITGIYNWNLILLMYQ